MLPPEVHASPPGSRPSIHGVLRDVAGNLRRLRRACGLSQDALARRAGLSRRMLVSVEGGDTNVSLTTLGRLADALGAGVSDLVREDRPAPGTRRIRLL